MSGGVSDSHARGEIDRGASATSKIMSPTATRCRPRHGTRPKPIRGIRGVTCPAQECSRHTGAAATRRPSPSTMSPPASPRRTLHRRREPRMGRYKGVPLCGPATLVVPRVTGGLRWRSVAEVGAGSGFELEPIEGVLHLGDRRGGPPQVVLRRLVVALVLPAPVPIPVALDHRPQVCTGDGELCLAAGGRARLPWAPRRRAGRAVWSAARR